MIYFQVGKSLNHSYAREICIEDESPLIITLIYATQLLLILNSMTSDKIQIRWVTMSLASKHQSMYIAHDVYTIVPLLPIKVLQYIYIHIFHPQQLANVVLLYHIMESKLPRIQSRIKLNLSFQGLQRASCLVDSSSSWYILQHVINVMIKPSQFST